MRVAVDPSGEGWIIRLRWAQPTRFTQLVRALFGPGPRGRIALERLDLAMDDARDLDRNLRMISNATASPLPLDDGAHVAFFRQRQHHVVSYSIVEDRATEWTKTVRPVRK